MPGSCVSGDRARESPYNLKKKPRDEYTSGAMTSTCKGGEVRNKIAQQAASVKSGRRFFRACKKQ